MTPENPSDDSAQPPAPAAGEAIAGGETTAGTTPAAPAREYGGRKDGTEPTRYGDWEKHGRCIDF